MGLLISGFPGIGKSTFFNKIKKEYKILDSDSSTFDKDKFPQNYIEHIKENIDKVDVILVSSHLDVREAMKEEGLAYLLVYPDKSLLDEYVDRYEERGSPDSFITLLQDNWNLWIDEIEENEKTIIKLEAGEFLSDILEM